MRYAPLWRLIMHKAFRVHMLNDQGKALASEIAGAFDELLSKISPIIGNGREAAIVATKLEEACFFAKKAIAEVKENQAAAGDVTVPPALPPPPAPTTVIATRAITPAAEAPPPAPSKAKPVHEVDPAVNHAAARKAARERERAGVGRPD